MKLKILILASLTLTLSISGIKAQESNELSLTLQEAQNYAIDNFFLSKNSELDVQIARKKILETTAIGLPQIGASADYQHIPNPPTLDFVDFETGEPMEIPLALENNLTYGATVSQLLFSGEYIVGLQAARVYRTFSEENYDKTKIDIRESIAGSYYTILVLKANKDVLVKTLESLENNLDQTKKTFAAGLIEDTEVDQLELTVQRTRSDLATLDNQIEYMTRLFKYQLGITSEMNVTLTNTLNELIATNIISDSAYTFVLDENIEYKILSTNEDLQKLNLNREKTMYLPSISGFYRYSDQTDQAEFSQAINHVFGVSATWNLFQSGMRSAKVSQAKIALEQAQNVKMQEAERLILTAQQAKFDYQTALRKYYNEELNFNLSEKVLDKTSERYKQGMVSSLELSIVNTQFLSAQISFATAIQELLTAKVALDKAFNKL